MQGRRPGEAQAYDTIFSAEPSQPSFLGNFPVAPGQGPYGGPPVGGPPGHQFHHAPQTGHGFLPPLYGYIESRFLPGQGGHTGIPHPNLKARPTGGLIGEVSTSGIGAASALPAVGYHDRPGQQIAKLRIGASGDSLSSANGQPPSGQLALAGRDPLGGSNLPFYGPRAVGQIPAIGQYSSSGTLGQSFGSSSFVSRTSSGVPSQGPPIGQSGQQGYHGTQGAGPTLSGSFASGVASPFVPASTSHPIIGGHPPLTSHQEKSSSAESVQRLQSNSTSGGLSGIGSISNLGSISQMGSLGISNVPLSTMPHSGNRSTTSLPTKVKAVCSSGGHFMKLVGGGFEYQGGETRLIAIPNFCRFAELSEALERIAGNAAPNSSASSEQSPSIKYQLPAEPNVYVDLVDDEDAQLMFDEWHEYMNSAQRLSNAKLHLFVDWHRRQSLSEAALSKAQLRTLGGSGESVDPLPTSNSRGQTHSAESAEDRSQHSAGTAETPDSQPKYNISDIAERMEVIDPKDVSLAKFLGSGGYGEVYLGKWHSSEAAIKCLNPSLFFTEGQVSQAAMAELLREADLLGSLRHPNVVWVYGIVLPRVSQRPAEDDSSDDSIDETGSAPASQPSKPGVPGSVRPPAIVTEFMSQGSLKGALQRKADIVQGPLMRVLIAMDAAKGMDYLHSKRIVHFDLKSANLLLGYRDRRAICKVADFGLSKQKRETYVTGVSSQRGTLPWIAPEIIKSPTTVNEKVDVYSFGVVLWELWTGKEPYDGLNYHALLHQITSSDAVVRPALPGSPDWDPEVGPEPAPGYRALMERCWTESPAGRPSFNSIVKVLKDMAAALRPMKKPRPPSSVAASSFASQRVREPSSIPSQQLPSTPEGPVQKSEAKPQAEPKPKAETPKAKPQTPEETPFAPVEAPHAPAVSAFVAEAVQQAPEQAEQSQGGR